MKTAVIMINENSKEESATVTEYGKTSVMYINAASTEDAARLLIENGERPADTVSTAPTMPERKEEEPRYNMIDLVAVNRSIERFKNSEEGRALIQSIEDAEKEEAFDMSVGAYNYLESLVFQGKALEAFRAAYLLGYTHRQM